MLLPRPLTLKPRDRQAAALGPKAPVKAARLSPAGDEKALAALIDGAGLGDPDKDGLREHGIGAEQMWQGDCAPGLSIEFELAEPATLSAIEVAFHKAPGQQTSLRLENSDTE